MIKPIPFLLIALVMLFSCEKTEKGALDNDTLARRLFSILKDDDYDKAESLIPDKGTYRKIMKEWKNVEAEESEYERMAEDSKLHYTGVQSMIGGWAGSKYVNTHVEVMKEGALQVAKVTTKFEINTVAYKYTFTSCKYNGRWFYMGDMMWVAKEAAEN